MNSEYEIPSNLELKSTDYLELGENKNNSVNSVKSSQKQIKLKNVYFCNQQHKYLN